MWYTLQGTHCRYFAYGGTTQCLYPTIKLWKLLIDKGMSKTQLIKAAKISTNAMAKLGKNEDVRVETLVKICGALGCTMDDIMELIQDPQ